MGKIIDLKTVEDYNNELGVETFNPLVSIVDMSELEGIKHGLKRFGFYCIYLKNLNCGTLQYGRSQYDYREGTLVFIAPGQVAGIDDDEISYGNKGWILMFHPDLLLGTQLAQKIKSYTFFEYSSNEALHMSDREHEIVKDCFKGIREEISNETDKHTKQIVTANIEVFLNHCLRFYDRQFESREPVNKDIIIQFENLLDKYFSTDAPHTIGLPSVSWCAEQVHLSPNYFGDLIKKETGNSAQEYIKGKIIEQAKGLLFGTNKTVSEIAYSMGFNYPNHFSRMFKKEVGITPNEFRLENKRGRH